MGYKVVIARPALTQIESHYEYIKSVSPQNGKTWLDGIFDAIDSLETMPERCSISKHSKYLGQTIRFYIYGKHIIDYRIDETQKQVQILSVWHSAKGLPPDL